MFAMALLVRAFQLSKMLQVAAALELADRLDDTPRPVHEVARACGADPAMLLRLCRALAAFGIFAVDADARLSQTARSASLRKDAKPTLHHAARYWTMKSNWAAWEDLEQTVRTGKPAFPARFKMENFEYLAAHPEEARLFEAFMQHSPDDRHGAVAEAYDFSGAGLVVDVGGGNGALLAAILGSNANVRGLLFDQGPVVSGAPAILGEHVTRCRIEAGDFLSRVPSGGDIYMVSQILHDWNDECCRAILKNCRAAMNMGARLLIIERILDETPGRTDPMNFLSDMDMMLLFEGAKERTEKEYARLVTDAGFAEPRLIETRSPFSILETRAVN